MIAAHPHPPAPAPALVHAHAEHAAQVRQLSDRLVRLHRPLGILRAVRWDDEAEQRFFASNCSVLPAVTRETYRGPAGFDPAAQDRQLAELEREVHNRLGPYHPAGQLLADRCRQARATIGLIRSRGTRAFAPASRRLFLGDEAAPPPGEAGGLAARSGRPAGG